MERDSLVFYRSFYEAIKLLPADIQGEVYRAIMEYSLNDVEVEDISAIAMSIFTLIKPQIDANKARFENGKKGAKYGKMGGRPKKEEPQENPKETPSEPQENPTRTPNVNVNVNVLKENYVKENAEKCLSEKIWVETVCMKNSVDPQGLKDLMDDFKAHCISIGEPPKKLQEFKKHFTYWLDKKPKKPKEALSRTISEIPKYTPVEAEKRRTAVKEAREKALKLRGNGEQ